MRRIDALFLALFLLAGCSENTGDDDDDVAGDDDDAAGECTGASTAPTLADAHNYAFDGVLDIQSYVLGELSDPLFDFGGLTTDLQGHAFDPVADVDNVAVIVFHASLTQDDIEAGLSANTLEQADIAAYVNVEPGDATSVHLSDCTLFGNDIDIETYFVEGYGNWLLNLTTGTTAGTGTRMAAFFEPVPGEAADELVVTDTSTVLDFTVDLQSLHPLAVSTDEPALTLDWSAVSIDGQGNDFNPGDVDQVMLAYYADLTVEDLEADFLDIELIADRLWTLDISSGTTADLSMLDGDDSAFTGIDDQGIWLMALRCTTCANPAPPVLTLIEACEG